MATSNTAIKITELPNIGNNIAATTLIPVVNMAGTPITQKANLQITGNLILAGAGGANFVPAGLANLAYSVANSYQPNITRVGNLNINTFKVTGGTNGQYLQTDGTGNLTWATVSGGGGNATPGGSNTQIQFNDSGTFAGNVGFTFNKTTGIFTSPFLAGNGNGLSNIQVANVIGLGNIATVSLNGNGSQVLLGNGSWGNASTGNLSIISNGNSNVTIPSGNGNVYINSTAGKQWIFNTDGNLRTPGNVDIYGAINFPQQVSNINWSTYNIELSQYGRINTNVDFFANANTIGAQYLKGDGSNITNVNAVQVINGTSNVTVPTTNGNVVVTVSSVNQWLFDTTGNLTAPGNIVGPANANFVIYANAGVHNFTFSDDGTFYAPDNVVLGGTSISIGPGANSLTGLANAVLVASSNSEAFIQGVINNVSDVGSSDWVAEGHRGDDDGGWADMGFTSSGFNDTNYTITGPGDGYVFAQSYYDGQVPGGPGNRGGNLVLATGENGEVNDIVFATGGFSAANEFARISDSNNSLELTRTGASITFPDNTVQTTAYTGSGGSTGNVTFDNNIVIGTGTQDGYQGLYLAVGPDSVANSQYLQVRGGDYPTHIHFDTGNNNYFDQYFGNDNKYVKLSAGVTGNVVVGTDDNAGNLYRWSFDSTGNLNLPNDSNIATIGNVTQFNTCANGFLGLNSYDAGGNNIASIGLSSTDGLVGISTYDPATDSDYHWAFNNDGTTQFPNNILKSKPDTRFYIDAHDIGENYAYVAIRNFDSAGNVNSQITAATDSVILQTTGGQKSWQFSNNGNLTAPGAINVGNLSIGALPGYITADANTGIILNTSGPDGGFVVDYLKEDGNANTSGGELAFSSELGNTTYRISLSDDFGNGFATKIWRFDGTGNITLPSGGSVYSEGYTPSGAPGNTITLNPHGSGSITNQKLMVYPTAGDGDHIHMVTGNLYQTELFLGSDNFYVKLANTGNVVINTNDDTGNIGTWTFGTNSSLTLPTIDLGDGLNEQTIVQSQRKVIPPYHYSATIGGNTPTTVYIAKVDSVTLKTTLVVQHAGLGFEMFDVSAVAAGANVMYSVSNRINATGQADTTAVVEYMGSQLVITLTVNSGATTSWVTYDSTEFGIPVD